MRLLRMLGNSFRAAVFTLVLPFAQGQAQQCVSYQGLQHCTLGTARLSATDTELKVTNGTTSGKDGVAISTGMAETWTAELTTETSVSTAQRTVLTSLSDGSATSTATLQNNGDKLEISATYTGAGTNSTFSALVYRGDTLLASVQGLKNAQVAATDFNSSRSNKDKGMGPPKGFHVTSNGECQWTFTGANWDLQLANGQVVTGADRLVLREEILGAGSYPYLGFDQILVQTTSQFITIGTESVVKAQ